MRTKMPSHPVTAIKEYLLITIGLLVYVASVSYTHLTLPTIYSV